MRANIGFGLPIALVGFGLILVSHNWRVAFIAGGLMGAGIALAYFGRAEKS